jgi:hypothetical protein
MALAQVHTECVNNASSIGNTACVLAVFSQGEPWGTSLTGAGLWRGHPWGGPLALLAR